MAPQKSRLRQEQAYRTREAIETAALDRNLHLGYKKLQIRDITDKAGCALGTFYVHFRSKKDLFRSLLKRYNKEMQESIQERIKTAQTLEEAIRTTQEAYFEFVENRRPEFTLIYREGWRSDPDFASLFRKNVEDSIEQTQMWLAKGLAGSSPKALRVKVGKAEVRMTAVAMVATLGMVSHDLPNHASEIYRKALVDQLTGLWLRALGVKPSDFRKEAHKK